MKVTVTFEDKETTLADGRAEDVRNAMGTLSARDTAIIRTLLTVALDEVSYLSMVKPPEQKDGW